MHFAKRISQVVPSATLAISQLSHELQAKGEDVIDLSIGMPDFQTPSAIDDAAIAAIKAGHGSFYLPAAGLPALREAISAHIAAQDGLTYQPKQIAVTTGAKFALYALFQLLLDPGDEVLIPVPYWVSYVEQVRLAGGVPRFAIEPGEQFKVTVDTLEALRTPRTRAVIINSPQNPSGVVYSRQELTLIANWALQHDVLVIADEIYRDLVYHDETFTSLAAIDPAIAANTVVIGGVSKSYAMTGWRLGFAAGPEKVISAMTTLLSHSTGNATAVSQYAALSAYTGDQAPVGTMRAAFEHRLDTVYPLVAKLPGFELTAKPTGAFYLFPKVKRAVQLTDFSSVDEFTAALLNDTGVAIVPGRAFGMPAYARLSYAKDEHDLVAAVSRIADFIDHN